jgi:hypothetical protein
VEIPRDWFEDWFKAFYPLPVTVLKVRLRPYCVGHEILLHRFKSSFVDSHRPLTLGELLFAVMVCSQTYESAKNCIGAPFRLMIFMKVLRLLNWRINFLSEAARFTEYLAAGTWHPAVNTSVDAKRLKSPGVLLMLTFLRRELGLSESQMMNYPKALANAHYVLAGEADGKVDPYGEKEAVLFAKLREIQKEEAN